MISLKGTIYDNVNYDKSLLFDCVDSDYIPVISCYDHEEDSSNDIVLFHKPMSSNLTNRKSAYNSKSLLDVLNYKGRLYSIDVTKSRTETITLLMSKGYITTEQGDILMVLKVHRSRSSYISSGYDVSADKFILYISSELVSKRKYSTFYRRLQSIYLNDVYEKGVEVRIIPSRQIEMNTFTNHFKLQYNTLAELDEHLKNEVGRLLKYSDAEFRRADRVGLNIPPFTTLQQRSNLRYASNIRQVSSSMVPAPETSWTEEYLATNGYYLLREEVVFIDDTEVDQVVFVDDTDENLVPVTINPITSLPDRIDAMIGSMETLRDIANGSIGIPSTEIPRTQFQNHLSSVSRAYDVQRIMTELVESIPEPPGLDLPY